MSLQPVQVGNPTLTNLLPDSPSLSADFIERVLLPDGYIASEASDPNSWTNAAPILFPDGWFSTDTSGPVRGLPPATIEGNVPSLSIAGNAGALDIEYALPRMGAAGGSPSQ